MQLPIKIDNCPIREAIFEIRFEPNVPGAAVFGIMYRALQSTYPSFDPLPILQLPEPVRALDPNLVFQPHYRSRDNNVLVQIGPKLLSVNMLEPYNGWSEFRTRIFQVLESVRDLDLFDRISRFGLRYTNIFKEQIFDIISAEIVVGGKEIANPETNLRTVFDEGGGFKTILSFAGELTVTPEREAPFTGSLIDIDVAIADDELAFFEKMDEWVERAHQIEKTRFFNLLRPDFLDTLEPSYATTTS